MNEPSKSGDVAVAVVPVCQVCGEALDGRRAVCSCSRCHTPHHHDCWAFAGGCSTFACGSAHAVPGLVAGAAGGPTGAGAAGPVLRIDCLGEGSVDGKRVRLPTTARPRTMVTLTGDAALDTSSRYTRLDLDTPFEKALQWGALGALGCSFLGLSEATGFFDRTLVGLLWPLAGALMLLRVLVDCTYVLDNGSRQILYSRSMLGLDHTWVVCRFDQVRAVGVAGTEHSTEDGPNYWEYGVVLELPGGVRVQVSEDTRNYGVALGLAERLARHFTAPLAPSMPESRGTGPGHWFPPMTVAEGQHDYLPTGVGRAGFWSTALFLLTVVLNVARFLFW